MAFGYAKNNRSPYYRTRYVVNKIIKEESKPHFDGVQGRDGSFHVDIGLGGLEAHPILASRP